jgi:hypothetical protein
VQEEEVLGGKVRCAGGKETMMHRREPSLTAAFDYVKVCRPATERGKFKEKAREGPTSKLTIFLTHLILKKWSSWHRLASSLVY